MRPSNCQLEGFVYTMILMELKNGESVCDDCNCTNCIHSTKRYTEINMGYSSYKIIPTNSPLPKNAEWCRDCKKQSSVPIALIKFNGKEGYALECPHCKGRYPVYKYSYDRKYIGFVNMKGDYIPPSPDGKANIPMNLKKKYEREFNQELINMHINVFGRTSEEAEEHVKKFRERQEKEKVEFNKRWHQEKEVRAIEREEKQSKEKVEKIKEAKNKGNLVWNAKAKCLVNKETGEIVRI